jgi:3-hydroxyisobutyrate dehydrogenase
MRTVGFIGAGSIGAPMARTLVRRGFELTVCDTNPAVLDSFKAEGIAVATSAADCAAADMVCVMVVTAAQVEAVVRGPGGLLDGMRHHQATPLVAIMSSVPPDTVRALAADLGAVGARIIDAPVTGGPTVAAEGQLTVLAGGAEADIEAARPVLSALGPIIHYCGPLGTAALTKIVNNLVGVTNLFLFAEAMALADRYGLPLPQLAAIMETGSGRNNGTKDWEARKALFRWNAKSPEAMRSLLAISRKDLHQAVALARDVGMDLPILEAVTAAHDGTEAEKVLERWRALIR